MDFLPMPHHVTHGEGSFALGWRTPINLVDTQPSALLYAQMLRQAVEEFTGLRLRLLRGCAHSGAHPGGGSPFGGPARGYLPAFGNAGGCHRAWRQ